MGVRGTVRPGTTLSMPMPAKVASVFTADNLLRIQQMAAEGNSTVEIAEAIGSTPANVSVMCSRHKIKIRRGPRSKPSILAHLPAARFTAFHRKAEQLQIPASVLAGRLLTAIVDSDIYEAVLDDKD
jgi:hypothetical protein